MNCPKCGLQTLPDQKFCRSCGAGLRLITQPLPAPATVSDLKSRPPIIVDDRKPRPNGFVLWGFIMMFLGVALGVIGKMLIHEDIVTVTGVLVSLVGMFLTAYPFLSPSPRRAFDPGPSSEPEVLSQSQPAKYLPQGSIAEPLPSITERTTDLLQSPAVATSRQKEDGESEA